MCVSVCVCERVCVCVCVCQRICMHVCTILIFTAYMYSMNTARTCAPALALGKFHVILRVAYAREYIHSSRVRVIYACMYASKCMLHMHAENTHTITCMHAECTWYPRSQGTFRTRCTVNMRFVHICIHTYIHTYILSHTQCFLHMHISFFAGNLFMYTNKTHTGFTSLPHSRGASCRHSCTRNSSG